MTGGDSMARGAPSVGRGHRLWRVHAMACAGIAACDDRRAREKAAWFAALACLAARPCHAAIQRPAETPSVEGCHGLGRCTACGHVVACDGPVACNDNPRSPSLWFLRGSDGFRGRHGLQRPHGFWQCHGMRRGHGLRPLGAGAGGELTPRLALRRILGLRRPHALRRPPRLPLKPCGSPDGFGRDRPEVRP